MEEQLISFDTAKLAKEKGFRIPVVYGYQNDTYKNKSLYVKCYKDKHCYNVRGQFSAPTQSLLQKWLREIHGYNIIVAHSKSHMVGIHQENNRKQIFDKWGMSFKGRCYGEDFNSYEEALEIGLQTVLKLI